MTPEEKQKSLEIKARQEFEDLMNRIMGNITTKTVKIEFTLINEMAIEVIKFVETLQNRN